VDTFAIYSPILPHMSRYDRPSHRVYMTFFYRAGNTPATKSAFRELSPCTEAGRRWCSMARKRCRPSRAGEGTMKAGRQQSARLSREDRMIGDLALSARRLRLSK
jgi:hypothetical protein